MTNRTESSLLVDIEGSVAWVTLNRPDRLNALNAGLTSALDEFFTSLYRRHDVRIVVLRGAGRGFCAGLDLKDQPGGPTDDLLARLDHQRSVRDVVIAMRRCPQPIICLINGAACGGGFALALASDIRLATHDSRMNAAFVRLGASGCDIGVSYFLPRMVGSSVAAEYLMTGRFMDAARAQTLGLLSRVGTLQEIEEEARQLCSEMLHATPLGLRFTKEALGYAVDAANLEAVIAMEDRQQMLCTQSPDYAEGVAAFLEKRAPRYA